MHSKNKNGDKLMQNKSFSDDWFAAKRHFRERAVCKKFC